MAKTMVRTDGGKTELWFRCVDLSSAGAPPESKWEFRSVGGPSNFEDGADPDALLDPVGGYSFDVRKLTDGTSGTDDELGLSVADDGSLGGLLAKAVAEAESREAKVGGQRIPSLDLRLWIEWTSDTTYIVSVRAVSYGAKRNDPEDGGCYKPAGVAPGEFTTDYVLDAADLGAEGTEGDVAWFVKTKILDVIKAAEGI